MVSTVKPKASATPTKPMPRLGKAAASTALPQPPSTSQNVPMNSAPSAFVMAVSPVDMCHRCGAPTATWLWHELNHYLVSGDVRRQIGLRRQRQRRMLGDLCGIDASRLERTRDRCRALVRK